jgi:hypothetical protein
MHTLAFPCGLQTATLQLRVQASGPLALWMAQATLRPNQEMEAQHM